MIYECIKSFWIEYVDDDGRPIENKYDQVQKGSKWALDEFTELQKGVYAFCDNRTAERKNKG